MLIEASFSGHDPKPKWNLVLLKKFSFNFTSFRHGQKGDVYTKNCSRKRKFYKWKVILQLKICLIDRKIIDSAWVNATIFFCLLRVAFTFSLQQIVWILRKRMASFQAGSLQEDDEHRQWCHDRRVHVHRESLFPPKVKSAKMRVYKLEGQVCIWSDIS